MSLLGIFLPIYVYEITQSLLWVILFFLVWSVAILVFLEILGKTLFSKISLKNILILSLGLLMVKYYFLLEGRYNEIFLLYAGILGGIVTVMYWVPYDTLFTRKFKDGTKHFGRENSKNDILLKLSGALAPLLGGAIITLYGFSWLFTISVVLFGVCAVPLLSIIETKPHKHDVASIIKNYVFNPKLKSITVGYIGEGMESAIQTTFWAVLMFLSLQNFIALGFVTTLGLVLSLFTSNLAGKMTDEKGPRLTQRLGSVGIAFLYIPRIIANHPVVFYAIDLIDKMTMPFYGIPLISATYELAEKFNELDYIIYRELILHVTRVLTLVLIIFILPKLVTWRLVFLIGTLGALLSNKVTRKI